MDRWKKVNIDGKVFHLCKSEDGRKVLIEERRGSRTSRLDMDVGTFTWIRDCLMAVTKSENPNGFWRRRKLEAALIFLQVLSNKKGSFGLLSLESNRGRKSSICIPEGQNAEVGGRLRWP